MRLLPKPTWVLSVIAFAVFGTVLVVDGTVRGGVGTVVAPPPSSGPHTQVPFAVAHGAQVVDTRTSPVRTFAQKPGTIALTFDGGPDVRRTAEILAVLDHFHVPATFFVDGSVAVQHPDSVQAIRASGSELGVRTFSTLDLTVASADRITRETTLTQLALAGATGETTYLARPPFSASVAGLDDPHYAVVERLADQGFVSVFSDVVGAGWASLTTDEIVEQVARPDKRGTIVGLDASQGASSQLASALARAIPALQEKGWTFTTVTAGAGLPAAGQPALDRDHRIGQGILIAVSVATHIVDGLYWLLLVTGVLVLLRLALMLVFAVGHRIRRRPGAFSWGPRVTEPVSVIVPAYNEKECIAATIHSLRASDHPIEIIVVDDGSTDETAAIVRALGFKEVRLVRQANGGKPAALNNGIRHAKHDIIVMIDGDTVFEPKTISTLVQPFARPWVGAVSGNAKVANRNKIVGRWQHIEYVIGFNIDRRIQDLLGCMTTIPGAVGAFRKKALREAGGVSEDTLAEDTDLTMAVCAAGWEIVYEERARAWTEAPTTLQQLWRQRYRWSYGTIQAMWKHRGTVLKKGPAGRMGRFGLLNLALFQVLLPALAPLIDIFLVYGLVALDPIRTIQLWGAVLGIQMTAGLIAFAMEKENPLPLLWMPLQQLVYRQMMYAVLIKSLGTALAGVRLRWQKLKRVGDFGALGAPPEAPMMPRESVRDARESVRQARESVPEARESVRQARESGAQVPRVGIWSTPSRALKVMAAAAVAGFCLAGCTTAVAGTPAAAPAAPAAVTFTPYVDISVKRPDIAAIAKSTGLRHVTLAFALAGKGGCDPAWGGTQPLDALKPDVDAFRAAGGEVSVATGGAVGTYLENVCRTPGDLAGAYAKILDATGSTHLDVDIETGVRADVIVDALAQLQGERGTAVTLTLPIDLAGLTPAGLDLVKRAAAAGVEITVNGMDMNFKTGGDWGQAMVDAAQAVLDQLRQVYPDASEADQNRTLSITVMIGRNDAGPITRQVDAQKVLDFARSRGLGRIGFWALGRDFGSCPGRKKAAVNCSGVAQKDFEFTTLLAGFAKR